MSPTVRLEGLSLAVDLQDLRLYFAGLEIPEGGVTIIGGERGLAYINFTTWVDAKSAIRSSGCPIKNSIVSISLSTRAEMERSIKKYETSFSSRNGVYEDRDLDRRHALSHRTHLYLRFRVTNGVTTTTSVRRYFEGLHIADILPFKDDRGLTNGALVKFFSSTDAYEGMRRYRNSRDVTVIWSHEREWLKHYKKDDSSFSFRLKRGHHSRSPGRFSHSSSRNSRSPRWRSRSPERYSRSHQKDSRSPRWHSRSPLSGSRSPRLHSRSPHIKSRSPQNLSNEHDPIYDGDFHVHVKNLTYSTRKEDLRKWFFNLGSNDQIKFLYDEKGRRTRECFVVFKNEKDYRKVLRLDKVTFNGRLLFISPISKSSMRSLLTDRKELFSHHHSKGKCLYLRNFPSDVTKSDIQKFFAGFSLNEEDISLLCDRDGVGRGEVLVSFSSEEDLERAEKLHRKKFKEKEIPMRHIPEEKLQSFLRANSVSLMPEDPYDCVTQEDDLLDEDDDQPESIPDEDNPIPDEDTDFHQTENTHECVTQADDVPDDPAVHEDEAPSTKCISSENSVNEDTDHTDHAIPEDATANDDGLGQ